MKRRRRRSRRENMPARKCRAKIKTVSDRITKCLTRVVYATVLLKRAVAKECKCRFEFDKQHQIKIESRLHKKRQYFFCCYSFARLITALAFSHINEWWIPNSIVNHSAFFFCIFLFSIGVRWFVRSLFCSVRFICGHREQAHKGERAWLNVCRWQHACCSIIEGPKFPNRQKL